MEFLFGLCGLLCLTHFALLGFLQGFQTGCFLLKCGECFAGVAVVLHGGQPLRISEQVGVEFFSVAEPVFETNDVNFFEVKGVVAVECHACDFFGAFEVGFCLLAGFVEGVGGGSLLVFYCL
jgi:hypothetical protein